MVENVVGILYNLYILCGVEVCDVLGWSKYIN